MFQKDPRRKKLFISNSIQGRLLRKLSLYWLTYHLVLWNVMFLYAYLEHLGRVAPGARSIPIGNLYLAFAANNVAMLVGACVVFPVIFWDMLKTTHQFAGPLVRFRDVLTRLARGERVAALTLRDGDQLLELRDAFNNYLEALAVDETKKATASNSAATEIRGSAASDDSAAEQLLDDLRTLQRTVGDDSHDFTGRATSETAEIAV